MTHALWSRHSTAGVLLASEPFDDDSGWQPIPDGQLVVADRERGALPTAPAQVPGMQTRE